MKTINNCHVLSVLSDICRFCPQAFEMKTLLMLRFDGLHKSEVILALIQLLF